jgi:hypothetical protein
MTGQLTAATIVARRAEPARGRAGILSAFTTGLLWSLPWIVPPIAVMIARSNRARSTTRRRRRPRPLVSVIIPARNEARNIERCVRSVLRRPIEPRSHHRRRPLERRHRRHRAADRGGDQRLAVIPAPDLPPGWFGKQGVRERRSWRAARSVSPTPTRRAPDLLPRPVNEMQARHVDLPRRRAQEMRGFWERIIQPQLFALLSVRYGGTSM